MQKRSAFRTSKTMASLTFCLFALGTQAMAQTVTDRPTEPPVPPSAYNPSMGLGRTQEGPLTKPIVTEIAKSTYVINEFGMDTVYLLVGGRRALLIDTGSGFFDLRGLV